MNISTGRWIVPTATGSEVVRLSKLDGEEVINNGTIAELMTDRGIALTRKVIRNNIEAGGDNVFGVTSTFRLTDLRGFQNGWELGKLEKGTDRWDTGLEGFRLTDEFEKGNRDIISLSIDAYREGNEGRLILGNVGPHTNTGPSEDDDLYKGVGDTSARIEFARQRFVAQLSILKELGVDSVYIEALRHPDEGHGLLQAARQVGLKRLITCFEAERLQENGRKGLPDPIHNRREFSFMDYRDELRTQAGDVEVGVGVNCIGSTLAASIIESGQQLDMVYPNQRDPDLFAPVHYDDVKKLSTLINESTPVHITSELGRIISHHESSHSTVIVRLKSIAESHANKSSITQALSIALDELAETQMHQFKSVWNLAHDNGALIYGVCCGGRPKHVKEAAGILTAKAVGV